MARNQKTTFIAIHGFLGNINDFLPLKDLGVEVLPINIHPKSRGFCSWEQLVSDVANEIFNLSQAQEIKGLMGYSMGGRLVLDVLLQEPKIKIENIFTLSAHTGQYYDEEIKQKQTFNQNSLQLLKDQGVGDFISYWQSLDLFKADAKLVQSSWSEEEMAHGLEHWSLPKKKKLPVLDNQKWVYAYGQRDQKYSDLAVRLKKTQPLVKLKELKDRGHRLLQKSDFEQILELK